jgi:hypothetical protein
VSWCTRSRRDQIFFYSKLQLLPGEPFPSASSRRSRLLFPGIFTYTFIFLLQSNVIHPGSSSIPPRLRRPPHNAPTLWSLFNYILPSGQSVRRLRTPTSSHSAVTAPSTRTFETRDIEAAGASSRPPFVPAYSSFSRLRPPHPSPTHFPNAQKSCSAIDSQSWRLSQRS